MANRVFDDRLGLIVINPANLPGRVAAIAALGVRDVFLPRGVLTEGVWRETTPSDVAVVKGAGLFAHLWVQPAGRTPAQAVADTDADIRRLGTGATCFNWEFGSDLELQRHARETYVLFRRKRRAHRLQFNVAPWKGQFLPIDLLAPDDNAFACAQAYEGNMDELLSADDVVWDLRAWGMPEQRATCCYAAACRVRGSNTRQRVLPSMWKRHRGQIFSDDLLADAGLL